MNLHTSNSIFSISPYCVLSFSQHMPINLMKRFLNSSHRKRKLTEIMYHPCASLTRRKYARSSKVKRNVYSHEHCPFLTRNYSPASNLTPSLIATGWILSLSREKRTLLNCLRVRGEGLASNGNKILVDVVFIDSRKLPKQTSGWCTGCFASVAWPFAPNFTDTGS